MVWHEVPLLDELINLYYSAKQSETTKFWIKYYGIRDLSVAQRNTKAHLYINPETAPTGTSLFTCNSFVRKLMDLYRCYHKVYAVETLARTLRLKRDYKPHAEMSVWAVLSVVLSVAHCVQVPVPVVVL